MKTYRTLEIATVNADLVRLDDEQAKRRMHLLKKGKKKGEYIPQASLFFKAGEVVGIGGDIDKTNMAKLVEVK